MPVDVVTGAVAIEVPSLLLQPASDAVSAGFQRHVHIYARIDQHVYDGSGSGPTDWRPVPAVYTHLNLMFVGPARTRISLDSTLPARPGCVRTLNYGTVDKPQGASAGEGRGSNLSSAEGDTR